MAELNGQPTVFGTGYDPVNGGLGAAPADMGIELQDDGSVLIDLSFQPEKRAERKPSKFEDNIAEELSEADLSLIASDLLQGIQDDEDSRQDWVANYNRGMDFLGLKIEDRSSQQTRKNCSTVVHPLMLWAIVNFQSLARAELLPAAGPAKVANEGKDTEGANKQANDLQRRFNRFLTTTAKEFYPDTDRGLFYLGYGGTIFKKVYDCALRGRAVSECVYAPDLIVSNDATDLDNASRVTHRIMMTQSQVRRMQLDGVWRDVDLAQPTFSASQTQAKQQELTGLKPPTRTEDQPYTIFESYVELDLARYGKKEKGAPDRLPLPYRVTIDKTSQQVLDLRRNWKEDDPKYRPRKVFVKYSLVPGIGFLDLGFLHLLGNHTRTLTGIWRILIDAGTFSNFPGGLRVKGTRQSTNEINPGPGEWVEIDTGPAERIQDAIMPLPYKGPTAELIQLAEMIEQEGKQIAGTVEMEVGEGRANMPVGTIMSMIEQKTQVMAAVHKRLHTSQQEELELIKERLLESPEVLFDDDETPTEQELQTVVAQLANLDLVPASDPNVPAQIFRNMQNAFLIQLAQIVPGKFDLDRTLNRALTGAHIDPADVLAPNGGQPLDQGQQQQQPDNSGLLQVAMAEVATKQQANETQRMKVALQAESDKNKHAIATARLALDAEKLQNAETRDTAKLVLEAQRDALDQQRKQIDQILSNHHKEMDHEARTRAGLGASRGGQRGAHDQSPRKRGRPRQQVPANGGLSDGRTGQD